MFPGSHSNVRHTAGIDATRVSPELGRKSTAAEDVIMSGETVVLHTQTVNQSCSNKEFTKPQLVQTSSLPIDFSEELAVEENGVDKDGSELLSTQRLARSIDSKISTSQILENSASTFNKKEAILESSDKNVDHFYANEVDKGVGGKAGEYYRQIQPTKTIPVQQDYGAGTVKTTSLDGRMFNGQKHSGEEYGAPRGRSLSLTEPETPMVSVDGTKKTNASQMAEGIETPGLPPPSFRSSNDERKSNPDIQDIITGIVKLLNGNVKVQANPNLPPGGMIGAGRPLRPLSTRINNRGPPRITDLPPLPPDFDTSGPHPALSHRPPPPIPLQTSRLPPPYPFDRPPAIVPLPPQPSESHHSPDHPFMTGVPLPEQVVPVQSSNNGKRPPGNQGIVRPQRPRPPRPRPSAKPTGNKNRRPQPMPQSDMDEVFPGINKETQPEDQNISMTVTEGQGNQDSEGHQQNPETQQEPEEEEFVTSTTSKSQPSLVDMPSSMSEDEEKEDVAITTEETGDEVPSKAEEEQDKQTGDMKSPVLNNSTEEPKILATLTSSSSTVNEATQEVSPASSEATKADGVVVLGGSTSEIPILESSIGVGVATPVLESSMQEILVHGSTAPSEWEGPEGAATSTGTPTSVLLPSLSSRNVETFSGGNSATSNSSHAQEQPKQTAGEFRTWYLYAHSAFWVQLAFRSGSWRFSVFETKRRMSYAEKWREVQI